MKVLINGACGHMGRVVTELARSGYLGAELGDRVDLFAGDETVKTSLSDAAPSDVIVDFSHHSAVITGGLLDYACEKKLPIVVATTGHTQEEKDAICKAAESVPVFFVANMSVGVALLCRLAAQCAQALPEADIEIVETHHNRKLDAPSGTALMLAETVRKARGGGEFVCGRSGQKKREKGEIGVQAVRRGNIVGIHEVHISTANETITLKHEAHDRALFGEGAMAAAAFLVGKPAGLYGMEDMLK